MYITAEFTKDAMRTNNPNVGQYGNSKSDMMIHAMLGIVDETWEIVTADNYVNMIEELGDFRWFCALYQHATDVSLDFSVGTIDYGLHDKWMHDLVAMTKRMFAYGESMDKHMQEATYAIQNLGRSLTRLIAGYAQMPDELICKEADAAVINKLRARYPEKFSEDHAIDRDLSYEREVLEQSITKRGKK